jgi:hypothetical protein
MIMAMWAAVTLAPGLRGGGGDTRCAAAAAAARRARSPPLDRVRVSLGSYSEYCMFTL